MKYEIGLTAGAIWKLLKEKGAISLTQLEKENFNVNRKIINMALGWLAREDKIEFFTEGKITKVKLTE